MIVNDLPLPALLVELISTRRWKRPRDLSRLEGIAGFKRARALEFLKPDSMHRETDALIGLFEQGHADTYGLIRSHEGETIPDDPSRLDVRLAVAIANNWDEEGLCLDYRPGLERPRVIASYFPDDTSPMVWKVIAKDFPTLVEMLHF